MNEQNPNMVINAGDFGEHPQIPTELPVLPMSNIIIFPYVVAPLILSDEHRIAVINEALSDRKMVALFALKSKEGKPHPDNLYKVGTAVFILKMFKLPDGSMGLMVQGLSRIRLESMIQTEPIFKARINLVPEDESHSIKTEALVREVT
ncbi:MAG TPA: LON peptidase substrate-binding domain-containing protein, partial [bacterium]